MSLLALALGEWVFIPRSALIKAILLLRGVKVGKNFRIRGNVYLRVRGRAGDIRIGNNVQIFGNIDLRNRERGKIIIGDNAYIDENSRFVSAHDATLTIGEKTAIGPNCIFNCGKDLTVGKGCILSGWVYVNASAPEVHGPGEISEHPYYHAPVTIEDGCYIGGYVSILPGAIVGKGAVVGANSVVNSSLPPCSIAVGAPAKVVKFREGCQS